MKKGWGGVACRLSRHTCCLPHIPSLLPPFLRCVGPLGLSVICRMLAEDYAGWRGGMPDLLLWRPAVSYRGGRRGGLAEGGGLPDLLLWRPAVSVGGGRRRGGEGRGGRRGMAETDYEGGHAWPAAMTALPPPPSCRRARPS